MSKFTTEGFGYDEDSDAVPFVPGVRRGIRQWYLTPEPDTGLAGLKSISWRYWWQPGKNTSQCFLTDDDRLTDRIGCRDTLHPETPSVHGPDCPRRPVCIQPTIPCVCGFYAYTAMKSRYITSTRELPLISGVIEGSGRLVVGDQGFRAHWARVVALALPILLSVDDDQSDVTELLDGIRARWPHVAIHPDVDAMLEAVPLGDRLEL